MPSRVVFILAVLLLGGCGDKGSGGTAPPPPEVGVLTLEAQPISNIIELPGRVHAVRTAEIRARVDGIIQRRLYREGSYVEEGAELFAIDPREMQASLSAVKAALERAEATAANAAQDVKRYEGLVAEQAISQQEYDAAMARLRTAEADVSQARAQVDSAQLNLDYTTVSTPIAGRAGRAQVSEGALVSVANATLLTTVEQFDPVYVNFSQSSSELLSLRYQFASGALDFPQGIRMTVRLTLEDGSEYKQSGHLDFLAMTIDQSTGTVALRAEFPNPDQLLLPGQFVNARIEAGMRPDGLMIPQRAVNLTAQGATVMVVGDDDIVAARAVELGKQRGGNWIIRTGLSAGDRVIIDGAQKVRPGQSVRIATDQAPSGPAAPADPAREDS